MSHSRLDEGEMENWWIDYMEGELNSDLQEDADLLLAHSIENRQILKAYRGLRNLVCDMSFDTFSYEPKDFENLNQKIMARVAEIDPEGKSLSKSKKKQILTLLRS